MALYTNETNPWKKRVLLPSWIIRDILTMILIASYALTLTVIIRAEDNSISDHSLLKSAKM